MFFYLVLLYLTGTLNGSPWVLDANSLKRVNESHDKIRHPNPDNLRNSLITSASKTNDVISASKINKPREDPRLYYLSDSYRQLQNFNNEVSSIYPGRGVFEGSSQTSLEPMALRRMPPGYSDKKKVCVKCPQDRTLIAKPGSDRLLLQRPRVVSCSGMVLKNVKFESIYGPKFGTLIEKGSHVVVSRIIHKNNTLQHCNMKIHVVTQECAVPSQLALKCDDVAVCRFTCKRSGHVLQGPRVLTCDRAKGWSGLLPTCHARPFCMPPPAPDHGQISCKITAAGNKLGGFIEGTKCRVKCTRGWHRGNSLTTFCRRGSWTKNLTCLPM